MPSIKVLVKICEQAEKANKWTNKIPNEISAAFFDNPLTDNLHQSWLLLVESYFGEEWVDLIENVAWSDEITSMRPIYYFTREDGEKYTVSDLQQLCEYLVKFEGWSE